MFAVSFSVYGCVDNFLLHLFHCQLCIGKQVLEIVQIFHWSYFLCIVLPVTHMQYYLLLMRHCKQVIPTVFGGEICVILITYWSIQHSGCCYWANIVFGRCKCGIGVHLNSWTRQLAVNREHADTFLFKTRAVYIDVSHVYTRLSLSGLCIHTFRHVCIFIMCGNMWNVVVIVYKICKWYTWYAFVCLLVLIGCEPAGQLQNILVLRYVMQ